MIHILDSLREYLLRIIYGTIFTIRIAYKLDLSQIKFVPEAGTFKIEEMSLNDLDLIYSINKRELPRGMYEGIKEMIKASNYSCYTVKNNAGEICGYCCLGYGEENHAKILSKIKDIDIRKDGYLLRDYTFKRFRRQGLQTFAIYSRLLILRDEGYETATTRVAKGNIAAEHAYKKFGFERSLVELHLHLFNRFRNSNFVVIPLRN